MAQRFNTEKAFQKHCIEKIIMEFPEEEASDNIAEWIVAEKKHKARVLHFIYIVIIIILLIFSPQF